MPQKPETVFRTKVRTHLKKLPKTTIFPIQQRTINGDPDYILCINSFFVALELKSKKGSTSPLQDHRLDSVKKSNGIALVAKPETWDLIFNFLMKIACENIEETRSIQH